MFEDFRSLPHEQRLYRPETEPLTVVNRTIVSRRGAVPYAVKDRADFINIADNFSQAQAELYGYIAYGRLQLAFKRILAAVDEDPDTFTWENPPHVSMFMKLALGSYTRRVADWATSREAGNGSTAYFTTLERQMADSENVDIQPFLSMFELDDKFVRANWTQYHERKRTQILNKLMVQATQKDTAARD